LSLFVIFAYRSIRIRAVATYSEQPVGNNCSTVLTAVISYRQNFSCAEIVFPLNAQNAAQAAGLNSQLCGIGVLTL
jgi:hypothetical protein